MKNLILLCIFVFNYFLQGFVVPERTVVSTQNLSIHKIITLYKDTLVSKKLTGDSQILFPVSTKEKIVDLVTQKITTIVEYINTGKLQRYFEVECHLLNLLDYPKKFNDLKPLSIRVYKSVITRFKDYYVRYQKSFADYILPDDIHVFNTITDLIVMLESIVDSENFDFDLYDRLEDTLILYPLEFIEQHPVFCTTILAGIFCGAYISRLPRR